MKEYVSKLAPAIKEYLEFRKTLGYSGCQKIQLTMLDAYCHQCHPDIDTLTKEVVQGWIRYEALQGRGGIRSKATSARKLALYMGNGAYMLPTKMTPKYPRYTPYILTDDELSRLFLSVDNIKGRTDYSIKLMFPTLLRLMYTCGLRPNEARSIKRKNINFDTGEILIEKTKMNKERIVVISEDMLRQCRKYDAARTILTPQSEYFFVLANDVAISGKQLLEVFHRCWRQANPNIPTNMLPRVRPYDLRHRFASTVLQKWLSEGRDFYAMLPYLRAYMGHQDFSQTAYYIHLLPENLLASSGIDWRAIDGVSPEVDIWKS